VGITKAHSREELVNGVVEAFRFDRKLIIEKGVDCREIECAVLGNDEPEASPPGEIECEREFYDYEAKYLTSAATLTIPARLPDDLASRIRRMAIEAYRAIDCCGMARVDFFLAPHSEISISELNTIPGFTPISMYPQLWQAAGLSYSELITRLVELGLERFEERERFAQA
jgi:D-alanine-D-alanine ligase